MDGLLARDNVFGERAYETVSYARVLIGLGSRSMKPERTADTGKRDFRFVRRVVEIEGSCGGYGH